MLKLTWPRLILLIVVILILMAAFVRIGKAFNGPDMDDAGTDQGKAAISVRSF